MELLYSKYNKKDLLKEYKDYRYTIFLVQMK